MKPDEWVETTLGEVCGITIGRTPPRKESLYWTDDLALPFCSIADMTDRLVDPAREGVTEEAERDGKAKRVPAGSLLMSFKLTIGRVGFAARDLFPNEAIAWLKATNGSLDERYLALWLEGQDLTAGSGRAVMGSTLNSESMRSIAVRVPPLPVQRRIVDLVSAVDTHISNVKAEARVARELSVAILDECVERALASASLAPIEGLLKAKVTYGVLKPGDPDPQGVQLIRGQDIRDGGIVAEQVRTISSSLDDEYARSRVQGGDIVLILVGTPGEAALVPDHMSGANISRAVGRLRFVDGVAPDYMLGVLRSPWGQRLLHNQVRGAVQQMINLKELRVLEVPVPEIALQRELAQIMSSATAYPVALDGEASSLVAFRSRLLQSLLSREVEIPESYDELLAGVA